MESFKPVKLGIICLFLPIYFLYEYFTFNEDDEENVGRKQAWLSLGFLTDLLVTLLALSFRNTCGFPFLSCWFDLLISFVLFGLFIKFSWAVINNLKPFIIKIGSMMEMIHV